MDFHKNPISSGSDIRLCVFLITSVCVGLLPLIWALRHMHHNRGRISVFIAILLYMDLIEVILNLFTLVELFLKLYEDPNMVVHFWSGVYLCGFHLHQLVALEGALTLKYPQFSAHIFSRPCYIIIFVLLLAFSIVNTFIFFKDPFVETYISLFSLGTCLAPLSVLALTFTITCKASSSPVSRNIRSVFSVAFVTFVMLYLPFMLFICVGFISGGVHISWYVMSVCLMSLRVISDPILCVLVCRNLRDVQTPETHTQPNDDETSL